MTWALNHHLHVILPGALAQLTDGLQLCKLRWVVGVGDGAWPQAVAKREGNIVLRENLAQLVEVLIQEALLVVRQTPASHDRAATRDDAGHAVRRQRHKRQAHASVHRHVVHTLLRLLNNRVAEDLPRQVFCNTVDLLQRLVDRHRANRHRRVAQNPLAGGVDVIARGQIHHRIRTPAGSPAQLVHLLTDRGGHRRVTNVRVDLGQELVANDHWLALRVVHVVRNDRAATCHRHAHFLRIAVLTQGDKPHLFRDDALTCVVHLGDALAFLGAQHRAGYTAPLLGGGAAFGGPCSVVKQIAPAALNYFHIAATGDPVGAKPRQANLRLGVGAASAVDAERLIRSSGGVIELDRGLRHLKPVLDNGGVAVLRVDFLRVNVGHCRSFYFLRWC